MGGNLSNPSCPEGGLVTSVTGRRTQGQVGAVKVVTCTELHAYLWTRGHRVGKYLRGSHLQLR